MERIGMLRLDSWDARSETPCVYRRELERKARVDEQAGGRGGLRGGTE